ADESDQTLNSVVGSITITDQSTDTGDPRQGAAFEAGPVHPNPASGTAILTFTVRGDRIPVKVELYSMQGTRITTLFDGPCLPGRYELAVNEKNDLDAGNYVLRITASGHSRTQILTITR
ncbi:MAG TPA: T9SS type A sorting domain-containing protein, partial [Bacteroidales bacterium]|nr:T9SS type A sorting domain-containing protein [Bacteroidales bacterium]